MINKNEHNPACRGPRRLGGLSAGVLAIAAMLGIATASANAAACPDRLDSLSASNQPACWRPFTRNSPLNTQLPADPQLAPDNAAILQHMATYRWSFQDRSSSFQITDNGSRPVYFASRSDPVMTVKCTNEEGPGTCQGGNGINVNGAQVHVPAGARPGSNSDAHMVIVETDTGQEYDFWHASVSASILRAGTGSVENVKTADGTKAGGDAAGLALSGGLLRPSELASGHIDHALAIDIPCTNAHGRDIGYVWPATGGWGDSCGQHWSESTSGAPAIGQLFQLNMTDAQIAASGAPAWQQTIMTALAHYGAYAEDTNGFWHHEGISFFVQDPTSWTSLAQPNQWVNVINRLGGQNGTLTSSIAIPTSRLQVIDPCVPHGLCPSPLTPTGGPATPATIATAHQHHHRRRHHRRRRVRIGSRRRG